MSDVLKLSSFESNLLRLLIVTLRLWTIHLEFHKQKSTDIQGSNMRSLLRDFTIEQLLNFINIRNDLCKNEEYKKLDIILYPLIKETMENKTGIREMRNNYISHIQDNGRKFKVHQQDIMVEYSFPSNFAFWSHLCGLAFTYCGIVRENFKKESDAGFKKYNIATGVPLRNTSGYKLEDVERKTSEIVLPVIAAVHKNGYRSALNGPIMKAFLENFS